MKAWRLIVTGLAVAALAIAASGCGKSVSQADFLMKDSSNAGLLQWTQSGHTVSGSLAMATLTDGSLDTKNVAFSGTISGSSVTLTFPQGFGASTNVVGTISGSHLRISLPVSDGSLDDMDFSAGTVAAYNTAVAVLTSQTDQARDSAAEWGIRTLQIGIQSYAVDHSDTYPDPSLVTQSGLVDSNGTPYIDNWPMNPYTRGPMQQGTGPGDFSYTVGYNGFSMTVYGENGEVLLTVS